MGERQRNSSIQQDMSSLQILDDILRSSTTSGGHSSPPQLEPAPGHAKVFTAPEPWAKLLPPVFTEHFSQQNYTQFNGSHITSRSIIPSINEINSVVSSTCKNEDEEDELMDQSHDRSEDPSSSNSAMFDDRHVTQMCCNSTELMAAIRQDIVQSGMIHMTGVDMGGSDESPSPTETPSSSAFPPPPHSISHTGLSGTGEADEETDSLNESRASSVDTTPYKRFFEQSNTASSPLEPLDLPHLLPRKRPRGDEMKPPSSSHVISRGSHSMSMDHILSATHTTSGQMYSYPAAQQAMAWNGMMYPATNFNTQFNNHGQPYPVGVAQHVPLPSPALPSDLSVSSMLSTSTQPRRSRASSTNKSSERKRKSPTESLSSSTSPNEENKPAAPYVELIAMAILSCDEKRMLIADIYQWLMSKYPYFTEANERSWRNSVRHNLSLMKCFVKGERAPNGRGFYWSIADQFQGPFSKGDFNVTGCKERKKSADSTRNKKYFHLLAGCNSKTPPASASEKRGQSLTSHYAALRDCHSVPITTALPRQMITVNVPARAQSTPLGPSFPLPPHDTLLTFAPPLHPSAPQFMSPNNSSGGGHATRDQITAPQTPGMGGATNIVRTTNPIANSGTNTTFSTLAPQQTLRPHNMMSTLAAFPSQFGAYQSTYLPYYGHTHYLQSTNQQISPSAVVNQNTQQLAPASQTPLGYYPGIYSPCNQQQTTPAVYNTYEPKS